jgi:hypothetical protein
LRRGYRAQPAKLAEPLAAASASANAHALASAEVNVSRRLLFSSVSKLNAFCAARQFQYQRIEIALAINVRLHPSRMMALVGLLADARWKQARD